MPMKPGRKTKHESVELQRRRAQVAELYVQGHYQWQIAERFGMDQSTVSDDLKAIREQWRKDSVRDFDVAKERELAKIDQLERTYWDAWKRSCGEKVVSETKAVKGKEARNEAGVKKENRDGNPKFLEGVFRCIDRRCRILGLDAPVKQAMTDIAGKEERDYGPVIYLPHNPLDGPPPEGAAHAGG